MFSREFAHQPIPVDDRQAAGLLAVGGRQHFHVAVAAEHRGQTADRIRHRQMEVPADRVFGRHPPQRYRNSHDISRAGRHIVCRRDVGRQGHWFAAVLAILDSRHAEDGVVHGRRSLTGDHMHGNPRHGHDWK